MGFIIHRADELYHYGILGMKWGVRRYQNVDGTLTDRGKKRYNKKEDYKSMSDDELRARVKRLELERQYNSLNQPKGVRTLRNISRAATSINRIVTQANAYDDLTEGVPRTKEQEAAQKQKNKERNASVTSTKNISDTSRRLAEKVAKKNNNKRVQDMSDAELKKRVDRLNLEQRYLSRSGKQKKKGMEWALDVLDTVGDITSVAFSRATLYNLLKYGITIRLSDKYSDELWHYGIKGQKWGVQHGPPYPLSDKAKSSKERSEERNSTGFHLTDKQKKYIKTGLVVGGVVLAAYGAYKISQSGVLYGGNPAQAITFSERVQNRINDVLGKNELVNVKKRPIPARFHGTDKEIVEQALNEMKDLNPGYPDDPLSRSNCLCAVSANELSRRGYMVAANGSKVLNKTDLNTWFKSATERKILSSSDKFDSKGVSSFAKQVTDFGEGSRGVLLLASDKGFGHAMSWEVVQGKVLLTDPQRHRAYYNGYPKNIIRYSIKNSSIIRLDNLEINYGTIGRAVHPR